MAESNCIRMARAGRLAMLSNLSLQFGVVGERPINNINKVCFTKACGHKKTFCHSRDPRTPLLGSGQTCSSVQTTPPHTSVSSSVIIRLLKSYQDNCLPSFGVSGRVSAPVSVFVFEWLSGSCCSANQPVCVCLFSSLFGSLYFCC